MSLSADSLRAGKATLERLLQGRPDSDRATPEYVLGMVESLAHLTPEEHGWLTDPRQGLHTKLKFLPTPADVHEFLREKRARIEAVRPAPTNWNKLDPDDPNAPWNRETDAERKRRVVAARLGYDPDRKHQRRTVQSELKQPTAEDFAALELKSPDLPLTPQLRELVARQDAELEAYR